MRWHPASLELNKVGAEMSYGYDVLIAEIKIKALEYASPLGVMAIVSVVLAALSAVALLVACTRTRCHAGPAVIEWSKLMQYGWDTVGIPLSILTKSYPVVGEET